ncbi:MAG: carboxypeptidase-like regulatory domain-containing protein, partial [Paramuribaculum sp.]
MMLPVLALAAQFKVTGVVTDNSGEPLIGVSVLVKGTKVGTQTNIDGEFSINAAEGDVLTFNYIGYHSQEITVTGQAPIEVVLQEDSKTLDEVVVTALGIKREQKSLSYNVQQVKGDAITTNKDANFVNSLAGKVAGVNINTSSSGTGGISKVVMRGTKSIMQSSNALYVVDGMPMRAARSQGDAGAFGSNGAT